jgi:3-mercaptopyruvate sulfurtransferase SseA
VSRFAWTFKRIGLMGLMSAWLLAGCQLAPTKIRHSQQRDFSQIEKKSRAPVEINDSTVILDARSRFDFGLNRVQGSRNFGWEKLSENARTGALIQDLRKATQLLSFDGVGPQSSLVVVGYGPSGKGEEGRLAWQLLYLGLKDVQVVAMQPMRRYWTNHMAEPPKNAEPWDAKPINELIVEKGEFKDIALDPKGRGAKRIFILDVRTPKEYLQATTTPLQPDIGAINFEWSQFYTKDGRPDPLVKKKLTALDIRVDDQIVVVSDHGVRSSAVAYALIALGFENVRNYLGGWKEFTSAPNRPNIRQND